MVGSYLRNIPVKLFQNPLSGLGGDVVLMFFLFLALVAILFSRVEPVRHFGRRSPKENACKTISKATDRFRRRCLLSKLLTDA